MIEVIDYRDTGYKYILGNDSVLFSNGVLLSKREFEELDKLSHGVSQVIIQRHRDHVKRYDFDYATKTGQLRELVERGAYSPAKSAKMQVPPAPVEKTTHPAQLQTVEINGGISISGNIPDSITVQDPTISTVQKEPVSIAIPVSPQVSVEAGAWDLNAEQVSEPPFPAGNTPPLPAPSVPYWKTVNFMVEAVMIVVAFGSAIMSAYHTTAFLTQSGKPFWVSFLTGCIMIFFSATAFTAGRYFLQERDASLLFGVLFIILGFSIVAFSMFSTITVNFNQFKWEEQKETQALVENSAELELANETKQIMGKEIERIDGEIERLQIEAEKWREKSWKRYDECNDRINNLEERRKSAWTAFNEAASVRVVTQGRVAADRGDIYSFISKLFNTPRDILRFIVYVIPSVFYDVMAPFGFSMVLLLEDRRRRRYDKAE